MNLFLDVGILPFPTLNTDGLQHLQQDVDEIEDCSEVNFARLAPNRCRQCRQSESVAYTISALIICVLCGIV